MLQASSFAHDAFEYPADRFVAERSVVRFEHLTQNFLFAEEVDDRAADLAFQFANFHCATGALVEQLDEIAVYMIDLFTPVGNVHIAAAKSQIVLGSETKRLVPHYATTDERGCCDIAALV